MHVGGLNHAITVERKVQIGTTALNEPVVVWQTFAEPFAEVSTKRGREHFDAATKQRYAEVVWLFRCHYHDVIGIDPSMRVIDEDGQHFDIKALLPDAEDRQDIIIECTLQDGVIGEAPLMGYVNDTIPAGEAGEVYEGFSVKAKGGTSPYTFAVTGGALPTGLTLDANAGAISGTPSAPGTANPIITVTDAAGDMHALPALTITVSA
jgi:head-tail adaptor